MLNAPLIWWIASRLPALFPGSALHAAALHATAAGAYPVAERLFERAAGHYRMDLEVEALARLRVHQLIARLRAVAGAPREAELRLEVEQRLARLDRIESLEPPFAPVPATRLLASAVLDGARGDAGAEASSKLRAAA